ncbi:hypothetical protein ACFL2J_05590 [Candidatus Omnitrophota bacterium]
MKELYKGIADILLNDTDLKTMVRYTEKNSNIRRGYVVEGDWNRLVVFYLQPEFPMQDFSPQIRIAPLIIRVYDRQEDLFCSDLAERIILLMDGADLGVDGKVFCYDCSYTGELIATSWNDDLKTYEKVLRFEVRFRVEEITGSSGYPKRRRKLHRDWVDNG